MMDNKKIVILAVIVAATFVLGIAFASYTSVLKVGAGGTFDHNSDDLTAEYTVTLYEDEVGSAILQLPQVTTKTINSGESVSFSFEDTSVIFDIPGSYATIKALINVNGNKEVSPGLKIASVKNAKFTDSVQEIICKSSFDVEEEDAKYSEYSEKGYIEKGKSNAERLCKNLKVESYLKIPTYETTKTNTTIGDLTLTSVSGCSNNKTGNYITLSLEDYFDNNTQGYDNSSSEYTKVSSNINPKGCTNSKDEILREYLNIKPGDNTLEKAIYIKFSVKDDEFTNEDDELTNKDRFYVCDLAEEDDTKDPLQTECKAGTVQKDVITISNLNSEITFNLYAAE